MAQPYHISKLFKTAWHELLISERVQVIQLLNKYDEHVQAADHVNAGFAMIRILRILRHHNAVDKITEEQAVHCFNDLKFLRTPWYNFPVKSFELGNQLMQQPDEYASNITYAAFAYGDRAFSKFLIERMAGKDGLMYIDLLIAALYMQPFDADKLEPLAKELGKKLSLGKRLMIMHTYTHVRELIINKYPNIFPPPPEPDPDAPAKKVKPVDMGPLWQSLWFELAETTVFAGYAQAGAANIYTALDYLERKIIENKKQLSSYEKK